MSHLFESGVLIEDVYFVIPVKLCGNLARVSLCKHKTNQLHTQFSSKHAVHTQKTACKVYNWIVCEVSGVQGCIQFLHGFHLKIVLKILVLSFLPYLLFRHINNKIFKNN